MTAEPIAQPPLDKHAWHPSPLPGQIVLVTTVAEDGAKSVGVVAPSTYERMTLMPTVLRSGPYRFYFYSHEPNEPPHVHVDRDANTAKFWLSPVALAHNLGFSAQELRQIDTMVSNNSGSLLESWNDYFA